MPVDAKLEWFPKSYGIQSGSMLARKRNEEQPFEEYSIHLDFEDIEYIIIKNLKDVTTLR